jgi:uncharacterized membrane protein
MLALAASVALNLFLAGVVAGRIGGEAAQGWQGKRGIDALLAALPEEKRGAVRRELRQALPEVRRDQQAMLQARAAIADELARPQPDGAALDRHFREVQARTTAMQHAMQQAFKRAAGDLTVEERRALIEAAKRRAARGGIPEI